MQYVLLYFKFYLTNYLLKYDYFASILEEKSGIKKKHIQCARLHKKYLTWINVLIGECQGN